MTRGDVGSRVTEESMGCLLPGEIPISLRAATVNCAVFSLVEFWLGFFFDSVALTLVVNHMFVVVFKHGNFYGSTTEYYIAIWENIYSVTD